MLLIQTAYQKVKGLGLPCAVVLRILAGVVLDVRANGAASGLKQGGGSARRAVSASGLSAGTNTISLRNPHRMLRTDLAVAALFLSGHAPDRDTRPRSFTEGRFLAFALFGCSTILFLCVQDGCLAAILRAVTNPLRSCRDEAVTRFAPNI